MRFVLVDEVVEREPERVVARKQVSLAEEYLGDHFPGFPVLPGVMMVEAMVQAARAMLADEPAGPLVLGEVAALKFGSMVRPGQTLEVEVRLARRGEDGTYQCRGTGRVLRHGESGGAGETAVAGRFTMRPVRRNLPAGPAATAGRAATSPARP